jgi:arylformamidase
MKMIDITRALHPGHPNWPGDVPLTLSMSARIAAGASVNVGAIHTSLHGGTHVDAPWHYDDGGARMGEIDLRRLLGDALVLDVSGGEGPIGVAALNTAWRDFGGAIPERVLLHTGERDEWGTQFPLDFRPLAAEGVAWLADAGVRVVGTDAPSVDPLESKGLPAHHACNRAGLLIIESLALNRVAAGRFELICLPLSLPTMDASPARAVLISR